MFVKCCEMCMNLICSLSVCHKWMQSLSVHSMSMKQKIEICIFTICATLVTSPSTSNSRAASSHTTPPTLSQCVSLRSSSVSGSAIHTLSSWLERVRGKHSPHDENVAAQWRSDNKIHPFVLDQTTCTQLFEWHEWTAMTVFKNAEGI